MQHAIREGSRGGRDLFSWEDVRLLPYKDREQYLGGTYKLGYLDKGGKWRKRDWYQKTSKGMVQENEELKKEKQEVRKKEQMLIMQKLQGEVMDRGLVSESDSKKRPELSKYDMKDITRGFDEIDEQDKAERMKGIGFEKQELESKLRSHKAKIRSLYLQNEIEELEKLNVLDGVGLEGVKLEEGEKKKKKKKEKKEKKREKKLKEKKKKRRHDTDDELSD